MEAWQQFFGTTGTVGTGSAEPEPDTVKADQESVWTPVVGRRRSRSKTPDPENVEATKKLRSTNPISDTSDGTMMDLTDAETRKRTLVETTSTDDEEPADKYWRAADFVAKASMDELTGRWLTNENGIFDHDAAEDTWADCLGQAAKAEAEATEKALGRLLAHGGYGGHEA